MLPQSISQRSVQCKEGKSLPLIHLAREPVRRAAKLEGRAFLDEWWGWRKRSTGNKNLHNLFEYFESIKDSHHAYNQPSPRSRRKKQQVLLLATGEGLE